jgi:hypothetical protein
VTTAPDNRGGFQPNAPQNSFTNVSGVGGAGQSGRVASGYAYGMNKQINQQNTAGNAAVASVNASSSAMPVAQLPPVTSITAPSELPDQHIMDGAPVGPGANSIPGLPQAPDNNKFNQTMEQYRPVLDFIASLPQTSADTRNALNTLMNGNA